MDIFTITGDEFTNMHFTAWLKAHRHEDEWEAIATRIRAYLKEYDISDHSWPELENLSQGHV